MVDNSDSLGSNTADGPNKQSRSMADEVMRCQTPRPQVAVRQVGLRFASFSTRSIPCVRYWLDLGNEFATADPLKTDTFATQNVTPESGSAG